MTLSDGWSVIVMREAQATKAKLEHHRRIKFGMTMNVKTDAINQWNVLSGFINLAFELGNLLEILVFFITNILQQIMQINF